MVLPHCAITDLVAPSDCQISDFPAVFGFEALLSVTALPSTKHVEKE